MKLKLHWYIPHTGHTGSFCGRNIAPVVNGVTRLTNEPIQVTCEFCLSRMEKQGYIRRFTFKPFEPFTFSSIKMHEISSRAT